jgi:hypothetical protein
VRFVLFGIKCSNQFLIFLHCILEFRFQIPVLNAEMAHLLIEVIFELSQRLVQLHDIPDLIAQDIIRVLLILLKLSDLLLKGIDLTVSLNQGFFGFLGSIE